MKLLAIVLSKHLGNTMRVAEAMAETAPLTIVPLKDAGNCDIRQFDAVGFGSGINAGSHEPELINYVENLKEAPPRSFVFSTSATGKHERYNSKLIKALERRGSKVIGSFGCKGLCKFFVFRLFGGINKGQPDENALAEARKFIEGVTDALEK